MVLYSLYSTSYIQYRVPGYELDILEYEVINPGTVYTGITGYPGIPGTQKYPVPGIVLVSGTGREFFEVLYSMISSRSESVCFYFSYRVQYLGTVPGYG